MSPPHPITVACILRSGGVYDATWVRKLRDGVARHLTLPHRFVCLTDMVRDVQSAGVEAIALPESWPGWWSKMCLWHPDVELIGRTLYFDLDTVVVGSLDAIAAYPHRFTMAHEFYRPHLLCSTAMAWSGDWSHLYEAFAADPGGHARAYDDVAPKVSGRIGDQAAIEDFLNKRGEHVDTFRDLFGERSIASWKVHVRDGGGLNGSEAVVAFHGSEKPHNLQHIKWIRDAWT